MKAKKLLLSVFASLFAVTAVVGLTACDKNKEKNDENSENSDALIIETALGNLKVDGEVEADFTLPTVGAGNVSISWASNNTDVIVIEGSSAKVTRPIVADETVKLTATLILNSEKRTKDFVVTVKKMEITSKTVAQIKAETVGAEVKAQGVVTGFAYSKGFETPSGFYMTDETGTIYVFGSATAAKVKLGDKVYVSGKVATYNSSIQIASPDLLATLAENQTPDWSSVITDKSIKEVVEGGADSVGNTYQFEALIYKNGYGNYAVEPEDFNTSTNNYSLTVYLGGSDGDIPQAYSDQLEEYVGKVVTVRFIVASLNNKNKPRGNVLTIEETEAQKGYNAVLAIKNSVELPIMVTEVTEIELPQSAEGYENVEVEWSFKGTPACVTLENGVLTITPTSELETFVLVLTVTLETGEPYTYEYDSVMVKDSIDFATYEEYAAAEAGTNLFVQGVVIAYFDFNANYKNCTLVLQNVEGNGGYYIYRFPCDNEDDLKEGGKYASGTTLTIYGAVSAFGGQNQINQPAAANIQVNNVAVAVPETTDITAVAKAEINNYVNKLVSVSQLYYDGKKLYSANGNEFGIGTKVYTPELVANKIYSFTGFSSYYNGICLYPTSEDSFVEVTEDIDAGFLDYVEPAVKALFEDAYSENNTVTVPTTLFGRELTYTVNTESTTVAYANGVLTITASKTETSTVTVKVGANDAEFTVTIVVDLSKRVATLVSPNGSVAGNQNNYTANQAAALGADEKYLSVILEKNKGSGVGYYADLRLYANATGGNGSQITISVQASETENIVIDSIVITYVNNYANGSQVSVGADVVTPTGEGLVLTYAVNGSSVVIKNVNTASSNNQVRIKSIVVNYSVTPKAV